MASRVRADVTERWWKQAWPDEDKNPPLFKEVTQAIKGHKKAKRGKSQSGLVTALDTLIDQLTKSKTKARRDLRRLERKKAKLFEDDIAAVLGIAEDLKADALRVGGKTEVVYSRDISKTFNDELKDLGDANISLDQTNVEFELLRAIHKEGERVATNTLRKIGIYGEVEKTYAKRLAKKVGKATVSTGPTAVAVSGLFLPGTQGFAIAGIVMGSVAAARDIADVAMSLERKAKILDAYIRKEISIIERGVKSARALEGATAVTNALLGLDVAPTFKKVKSDFKDIEEGVQILMHRLTVNQKKVGEAVDSLSELEVLAKKVQTAADILGVLRDLGLAAGGCRCDYLPGGRQVYCRCRTSQRYRECNSWSCHRGWQETQGRQIGDDLRRRPSFNVVRAP